LKKKSLKEKEEAGKQSRIKGGGQLPRGAGKRTKREKKRKNEKEKKKTNEKYENFVKNWLGL
jgi:hypothetical protein